jgi:acetylornithine deacetylase/succinyl-diaminopimelate desuccinylase-like protein
VLLVATSDEETGGEFGLGWLLEHHRDQLDAEYALNEGGRIRIVDGVPLYAAVQTAEKASNIVVVTATGGGGHAAVPLASNAIMRLARALAAIERNPEPIRVLPTTREFFRQLSRSWPNADVARAMARLSLESGDADEAAALLCKTPTFNAVLRNGVSPTILAGGFRSNVIPTQASVTLSVRTLPGESVDDVVARMQAAVADSLVTFDVTHRGIDAPVSELDSPMFAAIAAAVADMAPNMVTVPYLSTGATDNARLRAAGIQAYGLLPFPLTEDDERRMHGHDERVPIESLVFGLRLVHSAILGVAR